jgi:RimK family alpha-L-glutamate ligase
MKNKEIVIFYGGKKSKHLVMLKKAGEKLKVRVNLISYNKISFDTKFPFDLSISQMIKQTKVVFFRTTGKHWEEVNLIVDWLKENNPKCKIVDPLVKKGRPSDACKARQMVELTKNKIEVPRTIYGSLWSLYYFMDNLSQDNFSKNNQGCVLKKIFQNKFTNCSKNLEMDFPVILKGSSGDRGTNVFKINDLEQLEKKIRELRKLEIEGGKRYMLQQFIPNDGDYRILVLGNKVLGAMKRSSSDFEKEFRNNFSVGGKVEIVEIPNSIKKLAIRAAKVCGLLVAGVDVVYREGEVKKPVIWEVNKGPQFWGFMEATGIDVPREIIKFLMSW